YGHFLSGCYIDDGNHHCDPKKYPCCSHRPSARQGATAMPADRPTAHTWRRRLVAHLAHGGRSPEGLCPRENVQCVRSYAVVTNHEQHSTSEREASEPLPSVEWSAHSIARWFLWRIGDSGGR